MGLMKYRSFSGVLGLAATWAGVGFTCRIRTVAEMTVRRRGIAVEGIWFAAVGTSCFLIDGAVTLALIHVGAGFYLGRAIAFSCAVSASWYLNRTLTYHHRRSMRLSHEYWGFIAANLPGAALNYGLYSALVGLAGALPFAAVAAGSVAGMTCNFTLSRTLIFRSRPRPSKSQVPPAAAR